MKSAKRVLALVVAGMGLIAALAGPAAADEPPEETGAVLQAEAVEEEPEVLVPGFTVDPVGRAPVSCALGLPGVGVPCGSNGIMTSTVPGTRKRAGTVYRVCTLQKVGAKYDTSQCNLTFDFDSGSQIGVSVLVPVPRAKVEPKGFDGFVTGGNGLYEGRSGTVHFAPVTGKAGQYHVSFH
ncbi:hypothetical protein ACM614_17525 [Streptomyces sp. 12297]